MGLGNIFGGGVEAPAGDSDVPSGYTGTDKDGNQYEDGYKVADADDMHWLASLL